MSEQYFVDKELYDNLSANYSRAELEVERLNNIIDELSKWLKNEQKRYRDYLSIRPTNDSKRNTYYSTLAANEQITIVLDKLNELKGDNKYV